MIINVLLDSLEENDDLNKLIDNISGGNIRLALDLVKNFFGSGHINTPKIVNIYEKDKYYLISLHEFLRAVIFGDYEYYDPDKSPITNLFDVSYADPKEHFLLPLLIGLLISLTNIALHEGGFVETPKVYEYLQSLGYTPEQIDLAIVKGNQKKLLETAARRIPQPGQMMPHTLRVTTVGAYHIKHLCHKFAYIDAILIDTPIFDMNVFSSINKAKYTSAYLDVALRIERTELFRMYLDEQWSKLNPDQTVLSFDWKSASNDLIRHGSKPCDTFERSGSMGRIPQSCQPMKSG
jgi:hypothetical protein